MFNCPGSMLDKFRQLFNNLFEHGAITWERITVLFYVAGRMAVKVCVGVCVCVRAQSTLIRMHVCSTYTHM